MTRDYYETLMASNGMTMLQAVVYTAINKCHPQQKGQDEEIAMANNIAMYIRRDMPKIIGFADL